MDYYRGTRTSCHKSPYANFQKLMDSSPHPENLKFSFFNHSKIWDILSFLGSTGFCEVFGTLHTKIVLFDNSILLTGANFEQKYFTTRKDRYVVLNDVKEFADYLQDFVDIFLDLGHKVQKNQV